MVIGKNQKYNMKKLINLLLALLISTTLFAQGQKDTTNYTRNSNFNLELGTMLRYSSGAINYESESQFKSDKHFLKFAFGGGIWVASIYDNSNFGLLANVNSIYLYGKKAHHFEANLGLSFQFSKNNKDELAYQNIIPNFFLGYRYQGKGERVMFKAGIGAIEVFQIGIGYSIH